jgi:hypothetical protein
MLHDAKQLWRRARARGARGVLCCALLAGCSFEGDTAADAPNTCNLPTDCPADLSCQAGICVMQAPDAPLNVTLEVTPKRMPDGSQPFPILYGPFSLQGGRRNFPLAVPTQIIGSIHNGPELISAQLTFVPIKAPPSLAKPIQARSSLLNLINTFSVQLLSDKEYRVTVQPTDVDVPPYSTVFTATPDQRLDIDYGDLTPSTQNYWIKNLPTLPPGLKLMLKARAKDSNQIISNTADLGEGRVTLKFLQETPPPYQLEIVVEKSFGALQLMAGAGCDDSTPLVPTFTIDDSALKRETSTKSPGAYDLTVELPKLPTAIPYAGTIELCEASKGVENLLVSLRSSALAFSNMPQGITASYSVSTSATRKNSMQQDFCTRLIPGEYVVLATPPANVTCEIFAQKRQILAATEEQPDVLSLRVPSKLNGKIVDINMAPMANATIDAIALGIDTTNMLADDDPTVPIYNRSRQTSSDANGSFGLYVDVGVYDLIVKPPMQSGFGWQIRPGLNVGGARREDFSTRVELAAPALVEGSLRYADNNNQRSLGGADVHAYTVADENMPNARGVEIGHTQADEQGNVMLLISPERQPSW